MKKIPLKKYTDFLMKETETLLNIDSPTGYTEAAAAWVLEEFRKLGFEAKLTNKANPAFNLPTKKYMTSTAKRHGMNHKAELWTR